MRKISLACSSLKDMRERHARGIKPKRPQAPDRRPHKKDSEAPNRIPQPGTSQKESPQPGPSRKKPNVVGQKQQLACYNQVHAMQIGLKFLMSVAAAAVQ
ncbi:hypothetical protein AAC387_Pa04g0516 [Persea americana]